MTNLIQRLEYLKSKTRVTAEGFEYDLTPDEFAELKLLNTLNSIITSPSGMGFMSKETADYLMGLLKIDSKHQ